MAHHVGVSEKLFCALRFLRMDETRLAVVVYVGAVGHDGMGYHLISGERQKDGASYVGRLVGSETAVASCGWHPESGAMEAKPYRHRHRHHHPFCR